MTLKLALNKGERGNCYRIRDWKKYCSFWTMVKGKWRVNLLSFYKGIYYTTNYFSKSIFPHFIQQKMKNGKCSIQGIFLSILWNFSGHLFYRQPVNSCFLVERWITSSVPSPWSGTYKSNTGKERLTIHASFFIKKFWFFCRFIPTCCSYTDIFSITSLPYHSFFDTATSNEKIEQTKSKQKKSRNPLHVCIHKNLDVPYVKKHKIRKGTKKILFSDYDLLKTNLSWRLSYTTS